MLSGACGVVGAFTGAGTVSRRCVEAFQSKGPGRPARVTLVGAGDRTCLMAPSLSASMELKSIS